VQPQKDQNDKEQGQCKGIQWSWKCGKAMPGLACRLFISPHACPALPHQEGPAKCKLFWYWITPGGRPSFVVVQNIKTLPIFSPTVDDSCYIWLRFLTTLPPRHCSATWTLRAWFHVLVPVRFVNEWKMGDIIKKMGDVTHFMEGYFYVGCRFISISYFLIKFDEWWDMTLNEGNRQWRSSSFNFSYPRWPSDPVTKAF
jgi:hypothetical protein